MIPCAEQTRVVDPVHEHFLAVLPKLQRHAKIHCRYGDPHRRDDDVAEAIATAYVNCHSLVSRGRAEQVHTSGFITYSVQAVKNGRHVGSAMASKDVMSQRGRYRHRRPIHSLHATDDEHASASSRFPVAFEQVLADTRTPVPDQAAFRIDFAEWLASLSERDRLMIEQLATGERANCVARRLKVTPAAVSQHRAKWRSSWQSFIGEAVAA
jgi:DNA-binding NarL/FixJ family response regulator